MDFREIHGEHVRLRQLRESETKTIIPEDIPTQAKGLLEQIRLAGRIIENMSQRQRLESYALYWGRFLTEVNSDYPDISLELPKTEEQKQKSSYLLEAPMLVTGANKIRQRLKKILDDELEFLENRSKKHARSPDRYVKGISACNIGESFISRQDQRDELVIWLEKSETPYIFVSGEAGIGKTNFLLQMVLFDEVFKKSSIVFLTLKLSPEKLSENNVIKRKERRLDDLIFDYILGEKATGYEKFVAKQMIVNGEIILILDGLDELARLQSIDAVKKTVYELDNFIGESNKAKVIISCRDPILNRLERGGALGNKEKSPKIKLGKLPREEVRKEIDKKIDELLLEDRYIGLEETDRSNIINNLVSMSQIPLFYELVIQAFNDFQRLSKVGKNTAKLYELWFEILLKENGFEDPSQEMYKIGQVAAEMLENRSDFVELKDLDSHLRHLVVKLSKRPFGVFVEELTETYAFSHQSLREFILAWSIYKEITKEETRRDFRVLSRTSSFDYEGAETYLYLAELIDKLESDLFNQIENILKPSNLDIKEWQRWNNLARNLFEALGILAPSDESVLKTIIGKALEILKADKYKNVYVSYRTKFNIVRCLERLHSSAPKPYYKYILKHKWPKKLSRDKIRAYAIRGFHMREPKPGSRPSMIFENSDNSLEKLSDLKVKVPECLLSIIEKLNAEELAKDAEFLRINCSFALIRWLPDNPDNFAQNRIESLLRDGNLCRRMETNFFWMLYRRFGTNIPKRFHYLFKKAKELRWASKEAKDTLAQLIS